MHNSLTCIQGEFLPFKHWIKTASKMKPTLNQTYLKSKPKCIYFKCVVKNEDKRYKIEY